MWSQIKKCVVFLMVCVWSTLAGCSTAPPPDRGLDLLFDKVADLPNRAYSHAESGGSVFLFDQTVTSVVLSSATFEKLEEIVLPCPSDSGASAGEVLFVGCYDLGERNSYLSEGSGPFNALPQLPCEPSARVTDSFFRVVSGSLVVAVAGCGFFSLDPPFHSKEWLLLWDVHAYSGIEIAGGLVLSSYAEGKVRRLRDDLEEFEEWDIPGAYRMSIGSAGVWISATSGNRVWLLADQLTDFQIPPELFVRDEEAYLNDVCVWNSKLFVSDRYGERILIKGIQGEDQGWSTHDLGPGAEPTRWLCETDYGPLIVVQGPAGGLFQLRMANLQG